MLRSDFTFFCVPDDTVAKFANQNVHKRLVTEEAYLEKRYPDALKRAFLGTDEDLLASEPLDYDTITATFELDFIFRTHLTHPDLIQTLTLPVTLRVCCCGCSGYRRR